MLALVLKSKPQLKRAEKIVPDDLIHLPALKVLRDSQNHKMMYNLQVKLNFYFVFVYKRNKNQPSKIIYDGSQLPLLSAKKSRILFFNTKGKMVRTKKGASSLPLRLQFPLKHSQQDLADLLNVNSSLPSPHNFDTTQAWLKHFNLWNRVAIYFCTRLLPQKCHVAWIEPLESDYIVEAFTGTEKTLSFAPYSTPLRRQRCKVKPKPNKIIPPPPPFLANKSTMHSINMSSAVSAKLGGLTSAYYLGLLSAKTLKKLTQDLAHTFGALWIHLDQDDNVKHLAYTDCQKEGYKNFVISKDRDWSKFFDFLWQRHLQLSLYKTNCLAQLMDLMERKFAKTLSSKHSACLAQLKKFCSKTRIVVYSDQDNILHAFKNPFVCFAQEKKKKYLRGVTLKTDAQNTVVSLSCSFMQIDNVAPFFGGQEFMSVVPDWLPPVHIYQVSPDYKARGGVLAHMLHILFQTFCQFIFNKYSIDLHTWPLPSLTSLSFQAVWLKYAVLGGPFLHAPQKTKPFYEGLMRGLSKGGFSWSAVEHVKSGDILNSPAEIAKSICEYDICSSYGYAASQMKCPGGFCIGYVNEGGKLQRMDGFRHKGFEFQATFKFIHDVYQVGGKITAVYSNYHALGILYLGKYPVDLCVITKNLGNFIVQFDHMYTHGCMQGCRGLLRYASNKGRSQMEEKTHLRDQAIQQWVDQVNLVEKSYAYTVVSECHTPGYSAKELAKVFSPGQPLHFLAEPYLSLSHANTFSLDQLDQLPDNLTYILFCQGHVQPTVGPPPLFVWKETGQDFSHTTLGKNVMLSRLHYEYLRQEHNFQLDSVDAVLFYKTDKILPRVFQQLTKDRYESSHSPSQVSVIKCLINYACGYFGYNPKKKKGIQKKMLVTGFNPKYPFQQYLFEHAGDFKQQTCFVTTKMSAESKTARSQYVKVSNSALPIFCTIIDMGKLRLAQCFNFIGRVARPGSVKFLYTHIDNLILACSETHLEQAVAPDQTLYYQTHGASFFGRQGQPPLPGQLKLEFNLSSDCWKFATPRPCFYGLVNDQEAGVSKTCSFNNVTHLQAYLYALQMLEGTSVKLTQERRVNKLTNTLTKIVPFEMKGNK